MKLMNKKIFAIAALALGLGSCSSDMENVVSGDEESQNTVHIVVGASRENVDDTRTILSENAGNLDCKWSENDKLIVTNESGVVKGILSIKNFTDDNHVFAYFEGNLVGVNNGSQALNYYYLGTKNSEKTIEELKKLTTPYEHDYSVQTGTFENLTDYDIMSAQETSIVSGGQSYVENIRFTRRISAAHFLLNNLPEDFQGDVVVSGAGLRNKVKLDLNKHAVETTTVDPNTITIKNTGKDFRMIILPNGEDMKNGFEVTFTTTYNGVTYTGSRNFTKQLTEAKYYRKGNNDGTFSGLPVDMKPAKQYRVIYNIYDNFHQEGQERYCSSKAYIVNGDPTAFTPLDCAQVEIDPDAPRDNVDKADFKNYFYDFLGWTTVKDSWEVAWKKDKFNFSKENYVKVNKVQTGENTTIDLTKYAVEKTEGNVTYYDVNLYALGSVMLYGFKTVRVSSTGTEYDVQSLESAYRMRDWYDFKITQDCSKPGHEFLGWSRKDKNDNLIDEENKYLKGGTFRLTKDDECAKYEADYNESNSNDANKGPVIGKVSIKLYPVWKKIENGDVNLNKYTTGSLK